MDFASLGYVRVAAASPRIDIANVAANAKAHVDLAESLSSEGVSLVVFPELSLTGYSCEDLFMQRSLQEAVESALIDLCERLVELPSVLVLGAPWMLGDGRLLNCAFVLAKGKVLGAVPKQAIPNSAEFYEQRWFASAEGVDIKVSHSQLGGFHVSPEQVFSLGETAFAIEVCEDLWIADPPGNRHALAGAEIIVNLSASPELVSKRPYRLDLVRMASASRICGMLYVSSGPSESTKDLVFGGHLIAAENGVLLGQSERFCLSGSHLIADFDWQALRHHRAANATFAGATRPLGYSQVDSRASIASLPEISRQYSRTPFVPTGPDLNERAEEILMIQATGLARRVLATGSERLVLGVSGGLDSTLALLVCLRALEMLERPKQDLVLISMPGPGTSAHTKESVKRTAKAINCAVLEIPIHAAVSEHLRVIEHDEGQDLVFENAQARERTQILFDYAGKVGGLVVGTGDLSELALGWCTFNADHMAGYSVNASVPKTLVRHLIQYYADTQADEPLEDALIRVIETPISPELTAPTEEGGVGQLTEEIIGPYELHDFFLYHFMRGGFSAEKIQTLAERTFVGIYSANEVANWLKVFRQRFFSQQYKRTTLPPGPKVGTVSLSPRGDWRMPDEVRWPS